MKTKFTKAFFISLKYFGIAIMAYAILDWLYWQLFVNTFDPNPRKLIHLDMFSKIGLQYFLKTTFYLFIGAIGHVIYKIGQEKIKLPSKDEKKINR